MKDTYKHKGLRQQLVRHIKKQNLCRDSILEAISAIPRHLFLDEAFAEWAYKDVPFKIDAEQTISQPSTVAAMTELLDVSPKETILEIGTGSGYQACVLAYLGAKVYTVERQPVLFKKTSRFLESIGYGQIRTLYGDGYQGYERFAPYDKIIVTAGAPFIPSALLDQLKKGGCLVIPIDLPDGNQLMKKITKNDIGNFTESDHGLFRFVPMLPGQA